MARRIATDPTYDQLARPLVAHVAHLIGERLVLRHPLWQVGPAIGARVGVLVAGKVEHLEQRALRCQHKQVGKVGYVAGDGQHVRSGYP